MIHKNCNCSKIINTWIFALIPLIIYGFYKNGIILYVNEEINFLNIFRPLLLPILGIIIGGLVNVVSKKKEIINLNLLNGLLVGMTLPLTTNIFIFSLITFGLLFANVFIEKKFKFNIACLIKLAVVIVLIILKQYGYANSLELLNTHAYNFMDILFGRQIGGVSSTSVIWIIVGFIYLLTNYYYKKEIPLIAYLAYSIICGLSFIFTKDISNTIDLLVSATPIFGFVFLAPISDYSPATFKGRILFAVLLGLFTAILSFVIEIEAPFVAILVVSLLSPIIDNLFRQKITK